METSTITVTVSSSAAMLLHSESWQDNSSTARVTTNSSDHYKMMLSILLSSCAVVTFWGNLLVILAFIVDRKLRTNFNLYLLNLAVADLLVSVTAIPLYATDFTLGRWPFGEVLCGLWIFMDWGLTFASIYTLVAISIDRYWAACHSVHYRSHNTRKRALLVILSVWLILLFMWVPPFVLDRVRWSEPGTCIWAVANNRGFAVFVVMAGYHGPSLLMIFCYIKVFQVMRKNRIATRPRAFHDGGSTCRDDTVSTVAGAVVEAAVANVDEKTSAPKTTKGSNPVITGRRAEKSQEWSIFLGLSYVILTYLVLWSPFHLVFDILLLNENAVSFNWYTLASWCCYTNSALNPFLYAASSREFRAAFKKVLCCQCKK